MGLFDKAVTSMKKWKVTEDIEPTLKDFLRKVEAYEGEYTDTSGYASTGYGHKLTKGESAEGMTRGVAEMILDSDVIKATKAYDKLVSKTLNENQRAAVISLIFNVGSGKFKNSKARENLNKGDIPGFMYEAFDKDQGFTKGRNPETGKKEPVAGLVNRREAELRLFTTPIDKYEGVLTRRI